MTKIKQTLSRWHHIAQRLRNTSQKLSDEVYGVLSGTHISSIVDGEQKRAMLERGKKALEKTHLIMLSHQGLGKIRSELAEANVKFGVAGKLAIIEALRQEKKQLQSIANIDLLTMPSVQNANEALENVADKQQVVHPWRENNTKGVALRVVSINALDGLRERVRDIELEIQELTDEISEVNQRTISIELDDEIVKLANIK